MKKVSIEPTIYVAAPNFHALIVSCNLTNSEYNDGLWQELNAEIEQFRKKFVVADINKLPGIFEMRQLYKKLGKDPNRYRPAAESLCRRVLKEKDIYKINTLVDCINLISIYTGFSIGGFDLEKIDGDLILGVGEANEKYVAIGRGLLNIEGLPVYRDKKGGIGTPTSDEERTKIDLNTKSLLMIINSADGKIGLEEALERSKHLLTDYVQAEEIVYYQI